MLLRVSRMSVVALAEAESHYGGVASALALLGEGVVEGLRRAERILVKPNFVSTGVEASATSVGAVEAVLDFVYSVAGRRRVTVAEGPAVGSADRGFRNYGYHVLAERYDVEFVDLNSEGSHTSYRVYDRGLRRVVGVRVSDVALSHDFRISVCRPKTHDTVVATLSVKNMVMGCVVGGDKGLMHQGYAATNLNIALLAEELMPSLAVIDGFEGMEGDGPVHGSVVRWGVALAGTNSLEVDALCSWMMGFNPRDIGYLCHLSKRGYGEMDPEKIEAVGRDPERFRRVYKRHATYERQLSWRTSASSLL